MEMEKIKGKLYMSQRGCRIATWQSDRKKINCDLCFKLKLCWREKWNSIPFFLMLKLGDL